MCVCVCVCVYVCLCAGANMAFLLAQTWSFDVKRCVCVCLCVFLCVCLCVFMCVCVYVCMCVCVCWPNYLIAAYWCSKVLSSKTCNILRTWHTETGTLLWTVFVDTLVRICTHNCISFDRPFQVGQKSKNLGVIPKADGLTLKP